MKSKVKSRRIIYFIIYNALVLTVAIILIRFFYVNINKKNITELDFEYNLITLAATLGGFLFTGISILISVIDKKSIKPYWEAHYLDLLNVSAIVGIIIFLILIIISIGAVLFDNVRENDIIIKTQFCMTTLGIANFAFSIKELIFIIKKLKENSQN